ncbi:MAG TPA: ROK family protein [Actinomycetota bacterium]|nr:ROK family protein [Actinomycetota bacterium]
MTPVAVGVDLGGTKISAGVVSSEGRILERRELPSDIDDPTSVVSQIGELVQQLAPEGAVGLGIGAAGIVDYESGHYLYGPNTGLRDVRLCELVQDAVHLPTRLDNDANCAAWAEHRFGVGKGTTNFLCVTLGTGIGGGLVVDGRPYRGAHGGAAEIGHMMVDPDGLPCGCGRKGCWEQYASGLALERMATAELGTRPDSALNDLIVDGRVPGKAITGGARNGDAFAEHLVERLATWVGWGLGSLVNILEPERIAIAGGVANDWDLLETRAVAAMRERVEASDRRPLPEVRKAELGSDAGIVGAALLALDARSDR